MSLEALMGHLEPSDDDLRALAKAAEENVQTEVARIGYKSLSSMSTQVICSPRMCLHTKPSKERR